MTREQHLDWAKARAHQDVDMGQLRNAVMGMISDLGKYPGLRSKATAEAADVAMAYAEKGDAASVRRWIESFKK